MVTKGIIQSINFNGNTCTIRLPFFETTHNDPIVTTATFSNTPGMYNGYKVSDVVWVAFEDGQMETPVVIGKLYLGAEKEKADPRGTVNTEAFTASKTAAIPADTYLRSNTDKEIPNTAHPYGSLSTVANDLNSLNKDVEYHNWYNENKFKNIISLANGKSTTYYSKTDPSKDPTITLYKGDTWFNTGDSYYNVGKKTSAENYEGYWIKNYLPTTEELYEFTNKLIGQDIKPYINDVVVFADGQPSSSFDSFERIELLNASINNNIYSITTKLVPTNDSPYEETFTLYTSQIDSCPAPVIPLYWVATLVPSHVYGFLIFKYIWTEITADNYKDMLPDASNLPDAYTKAALFEWDGIKWHDVDAEIIANKLTVNKINAMDIVAKKIEVKDANNKTLFLADGLSDTHEVTIAGWEITDSSLQKTYPITASGKTETYSSILGADYKKEVHFGENSYDDTWTVLLGKDTATDKFDGTFGITNDGLVFTNKLNIFGGTVAIDPVFNADNTGLYINRSTNKVVELDADNITADHIAASNTADFAKALTDTSIVEELNIAPDKYAESSTENPALKISSKNIGGGTEEYILKIKDFKFSTPEPKNGTVHFTGSILTGTTEGGKWNQRRITEDISVQITCIGYVSYQKNADPNRPINGIRMVTASKTETLTKGGWDFRFELSVNVPGLNNHLDSPSPRVTVSPDKLILNTGVTVTFSATKPQITGPDNNNYTVKYDLITDKTLPEAVNKRDDEGHIQGYELKYILIGDVYNAETDARIQTGVNLLPDELQPEIEAGKHFIECEKNISNKWGSKTVYFKNVQVQFYDEDSKEKWIDSLELDMSGTFYNSVISSVLPDENKYPNDILIYGNLIPTERSYLYPEPSSESNSDKDTNDESPSALLGTAAHPWTVYADKINLKGGISPVGRACILGEPDHRLNNIYTSSIGDKTNRVDSAWTSVLDTNLLYIRNKIVPRNNSCDIGEPDSLIRNIYASNLKVKTIGSTDEPVDIIKTAKLTVNGNKALLAPEQLYIEAGTTTKTLTQDEWRDIWDYNPKNITVISVTANPMRESNDEDLSFSDVGGIAVRIYKKSATKWWIKLGNDGKEANVTYIIVYKYNS